MVATGDLTMARRLDTMDYYIQVLMKPHTMGMVRERSCAPNFRNLVVIESSGRIETHKFCAPPLPTSTNIYQHLPTNASNLHWTCCEDGRSLGTKRAPAHIDAFWDEAIWLIVSRCFKMFKGNLAAFSACWEQQPKFPIFDGLFVLGWDWEKMSVETAMGWTSKIPPGTPGPGTVSALILPPQRQDSHWAALSSWSSGYGWGGTWNISGWPWNLWLDFFQA